MSPYRAKASPKMRIRIIPTKILSCWAFALTPASPTIPIAKPAALMNIFLPRSWSHSTVLRPNERKLIYQSIRLQWLSRGGVTSLDDDDGDDHAVDTQDTGHDHGNNWFHDQFGLEDTHRADSNAGFCAPISSSKISEDECWCYSDISEEVLRAICCCARHSSWLILLCLVRLIISSGNLTNKDLSDLPKDIKYQFLFLLLLPDSDKFYCIQCFLDSS